MGIARVHQLNFALQRKEKNCLFHTGPVSYPGVGIERWRSWRRAEV